MSDPVDSSLTNSDPLEGVLRERDHLRQRVRELEAQVALEQTRKQERRSRLQRTITWIAVRSAGAASIVPAMQDLIKASKKEKGVPTREAAELAEALVARILRVGWSRIFLAFLAATPGFVTAVFLFWQIQKQQSANELVQRQLEHQQAAHETVQRFRLVDTLYNVDCVQEEGRGRECTPRADARSRAEAVLAFIELERPKQNGTLVDLSGARLDDTILKGYDLAYVNLARATLRRADLSGADLSESVFEKTDLSQANLSGSNLTATFFEEANLVGAQLDLSNLTDGAFLSVDLQDADLRGANLHGSVVLLSDLRGALLGASADTGPASVFEGKSDAGDMHGNAKLEHSGFKYVCYDDSTVWPTSFSPPREICDPPAQIASSIRNIRASIQFPLGDRDGGYLKSHEEWLETIPESVISRAKFAPHETLQEASEAYNAGVLLEVQGNFDGAINAYRKSARSDPNFSWAQYSLAGVFLKQGKLEEALGHCRAAAAIDPDFGLAHAGIGFILDSQGMTREAMLAYDKAARAQRKVILDNPDFAPAYHAMGYALERQGKIKEAKDAFKKAKSLGYRGAETGLNQPAQGDRRTMETQRPSALAVREGLRLYMSLLPEVVDSTPEEGN